MPRKRIHFSKEEVRAAKTKSAMKCYYADIEKARRIRREWYNRNKEKLRGAWNLRDKRKGGAEGSYTTSDVDRIYSDQRGKCAICCKKLGAKFHRDHIVPLKLGGTNWPRNIQLLCAPCNMSKGARDPVDHMQSLGRLL